MILLHGMSTFYGVVITNLIYYCSNWQTKIMVLMLGACLIAAYFFFLSCTFVLSYCALIHYNITKTYDSDSKKYDSDSP